MVSKIFKKSPQTPSKSPIPSRRRRTPSPDKPIPADHSIRRSLRLCRRKLLRIFAHLAIFPPPTSQTLGYRRLKPITKEPALIIPPQTHPSKKTLFLDLDETLIHSTTDPPPGNYDFVVYPSIDGQTVPFYVLKRPGVDELLKKAAQNFEVIVFTAGLREYASLVVDELDPKGEAISHRLYRDSCKEIGGRFVKDLSGFGRDLGRVVIVDDNPGSYTLQPENAVPVKPFISDLEDEELRRVMEFLEVAGRFDDIREAVKGFLVEKEDLVTD